MGLAASAKQHPWGSATAQRFQVGHALGRPTQERSVPLALASLVLGSRRSETSLCEIGSGELARVRRGHEARATRADRTTVSLLV